LATRFHAQRQEETGALTVDADSHTFGNLAAGGFFGEIELPDAREIGRLCEQRQAAKQKDSEFHHARIIR
jgi:hypothetical protein